MRPSWRKQALGLGFGVTTACGAEGAIHSGAVPGGWAAVPIALMVVGGMGLAWLLSRVRWKNAIRYLAGADAAVALLTAVLLATIAGTLVVQNVPAAAFGQRYGGLAAPLKVLQLDHVFRSFAFVILCGLLGSTSVITVLRRWRSLIRWSHWGRLAMHLALVLVLLGGFVGLVAGSRGTIQLQEGEVATGFALQSPAAGATAGSRALGFRVRLDRFEIDHHEQAHRLYTLEADHAGGYRVLASHEPLPGETIAIPDADVLVRVERSYGSVEVSHGWREDPEPPAGVHARPAARVTVIDETAQLSEAWLVGAEGQERRWRDPEGRFELAVSWNEPGPSLLRTLGKRLRPARHLLSFADGRQLSVWPRDEIDLGAGRKARVRTTLPDYYFNARTGEPATRSMQPNNPALVLDLLAQGGPAEPAEELVLLAHANAGSAEPRYRYEPVTPGAARSIVIVGASAERLDVVGTRVVARSALDWDTPFEIGPAAPGIRVVAHAPIRWARSSPSYREIRTSPARPAVEITVTSAQGSSRKLLRGDEPTKIDLGGGRILVYRQRPDAVRSYDSTLTLLDDDGQVLGTHVVRVNSPLSYGGFGFYQADFDPDRPGHCTLLVVSDPGAALVTLGLWLLALGAMHHTTLRKKPWRRRKDRTHTPATRAAEKAL